MPVYDLLSGLKRCEDLLEAFGGHAQACGLTLDAKNLQPFRELVNRHAKEQLGREGLVRTRQVDVELPLEAIQPTWVRRLEAFAPFGRGNPRPTVIIRDITIEVESPRTGWVTDGRRRVKVKGSLPPVPSGRYDVAVSPTLIDGELVLTVSDVRVSSGLSAPGRISGTPYRREPVP